MPGHPEPFSRPPCFFNLYSSHFLREKTGLRDNLLRWEEGGFDDGFACALEIVLDNTITDGVSGKIRNASFGLPPGCGNGIAEDIAAHRIEAAHLKRTANDAPGCGQFLLVEISDKVADQFLSKELSCECFSQPFGDDIIGNGDLHGQEGHDLETDVVVELMNRCWPDAGQRIVVGEAERDHEIAWEATKSRIASTGKIAIVPGEDHRTVDGIQSNAGGYGGECSHTPFKCNCEPLPGPIIGQSPDHVLNEGTLLAVEIDRVPLLWNHQTWKRMDQKGKKAAVSVYIVMV